MLHAEEARHILESEDVADMCGPPHQRGLFWAEKWSEQTGGYRLCQNSRCEGRRFGLKS